MLHVGRIAHEKNIEFLFQVAARVRAQIPELLFIVAGEGPALSGLRRLTAELGLERHVLFTGYLSRARELQDCYRAGNVFVFASRTETQGLVLLEAMALGVPVVSTAMMGTRDLIEPQRGALLAPEDVDEFAAMTVELLGSPERRARMGREGRDFAASWSSGVMAERLEAVYARLIP